MVRRTDVKLDATSARLPYGQSITGTCCKFPECNNRIVLWLLVWHFLTKSGETYAYGKVKPTNFKPSRVEDVSIFYQFLIEPSALMDTPPKMNLWVIVLVVWSILGQMHTSHGKLEYLQPTYFTTSIRLVYLVDETVCGPFASLLFINCGLLVNFDTTGLTDIRRLLSFSCANE